MAVNKHPFIRSRNNNAQAVMFLGLVQDGDTQAIKDGELCTWNETTGYFVPVDAVADHRYNLAIAAEEQKASSGRSGILTGERYIPFFALHPDDIFEMELVAAAAWAVGAPFTLAADSQKLTSGAGDFAVAIGADTEHYPQEEDTTIRSQNFARVTFNPSATYFGNFMNLANRAGRRLITVTSNETFKASDMYNTLVHITGATEIELPAVAPGMDAIFVNINGDTQALDPNSSDQIRLDGALLTAGNKITQTTIAFSCQLISEGAAGFTCLSVPGQWTDGGA